MSREVVPTETQVITVSEGERWTCDGPSCVTEVMDERFATPSGWFILIGPYDPAVSNMRQPTTDYCSEACLGAAVTTNGAR
jgi:hypothetical protein